MADRVKGIEIVIGGNTQGLSKALSGVNKEISNTQKQLKDVERLLKMDPGNVELLEQRQRLLGDAVQETKTKLDALKKAEKQVQQQFQEGKVSQQQYDALQREIAATEQQLKKLEDQAKVSNDTLQRIGQAADTVAKGASKIADGLDKVRGAATVASGAVIGVGAYGVKSISDIDSAMGTFISRTGEAEDSASRWRDAMEDIYNSNYGESFEDVAEAMAAVKNQLDAISPDDVEALTKSALTLRDAFGYDISESVRTAQALINNFGVEGNQAFELIAEGSQNGLDYSGELLDSISEYSVQFGKLGFSAEEMFGVFSTGAENGAFNLDKVGDAVKEFSIRAIDGSDTTIAGFEAIGLSAEEMADKFAAGGDEARNAFDQVISGLQGIEDPVAQSAAGVNLFGTMWEDLGPQVVLSLNDISDAAYGADDALKQIEEAKYDNLASDLAGIGRTVQTDIIVPLLEQLMPTIETVVEKVEGFVDAFSNMSEGQQTFVLAVGGVIAVLPVVISLLSSLFTVIGTVSNGIALFTGAATSGTAAAQGISAVLKGISTAAGAIPSIISSVITTVSGGISTFFTFLTGTVVPGITSALSGLFAFLMANPVILIIAAITAAIVALVALIAVKGEEILAILESVDDWLQSVFLTDWTTLFGPVLGNVLNGFFANVKNIWDAIKQVFEGIINFIRGVFTGDWQRAWQGVQDIIGGIFEGMVALVKAPINAIIGLLNGAIDGINKMIDGLNEISFDIPDWVPGLGGKSFGLDIPNIGKIPYLAKGGILSSGSAIVGEAGPELLTVAGGRAIVQPLTGSSPNKAGISITMNNTFNGYTPATGEEVSRDLVRAVNRALGRAY